MRFPTRGRRILHGCVDPADATPRTAASLLNISRAVQRRQGSGRVAPILAAKAGRAPAWEPVVRSVPRDRRFRLAWVLENLRPGQVHGHAARTRPRGLSGDRQPLGLEIDLPDLIRS